MRGGAVSVYDSAYTNIDIDTCYFTGNNVFGDNMVSPNADGGAISIYPVNRARNISIKNSTFYKNWAQDDGGAIFLENTLGTDVIENNTFVQNYSLDSHPTFSSGGAIQLSLDTKIALNNNTFYKNMCMNRPSTLAEVANIKHGGGAIGAYYTTTAFSGQYTSSANIFIDNVVCSSITNFDTYTVEASNYSNIGRGRTGSIIKDTDSIGIDNGTALPSNMTAEHVFGPGNINMGSYDNKNKAGYEETAIPVLRPILPASANGLAGSQVSSPKTTADQRGYPRKTVSDVGAIEVLNIEFDANGGKWTGGANQKSYDGYTYSANDSNGERTSTYKVTAYDNNVSVLSDTPTNGSLKFAGWNTKKDGNGISYAANDSLKITQDTTLYAQWQPAATYTVTYDGNGNTKGTAPTDSNSYDLGDTVTVLGKADLERTDYTFTGWNTKKDGSGTTYQKNDTFDISDENVNLYAQWKKNDNPPQPRPDDPKTGDNNNVILWVIITLVAATAAGALIIAKKKNK